MKNIISELSLLEKFHTFDLCFSFKQTSQCASRQLFHENTDAIG